MLLLVTASVGAIAMTNPAAQVAVWSSPTVPCQHVIRPPPSNYTTLPNGSEVIQSASPVFLLEPGSTATFCVSYSSFPNYNLTYSQSSGVSVATWGPAGASEQTEGIGAEGWPEVFYVGPGQNASAWYSVTVAASVEGFFGLWVAQDCPAIPFAVGYQASQVNASDFPGLFGTQFGCGPIYLDAALTGYSGAGLVYVTTESTIP